MSFTLGIWQRVLKRKLGRIPQFISATQEPKSGPGHLIARVSMSHTHTARMTPLNQWPDFRIAVTYLTHNKRGDENLCPQRDLNLQSQKSTGRKEFSSTLLYYRLCMISVSKLLHKASLQLNHQNWFCGNKL
jgi:hypothetical protein